MKEITTRLTRSLYFKDYILNINSEYIFTEKEIIINMQLENSYDNLELDYQFALLEYYTKQLRYFMHDGLYPTSLEKKKIRILAQTGHTQYELVNGKVPNHKTIIESKSVFFINKKPSYTSNELKTFFSQEMSSNPLLTRELEILEYAQYFYKILTQTGKYFNPERDAPIILKAVCDKFNITPEEYNQIYMKHYLGL